MHSRKNICGVHKHIWSSFYCSFRLYSCKQGKTKGKLHWEVLARIYIHLNLLLHMMRLSQKRKFKITTLSPKASYYSTIIGVGACITWSHKLWSLGVRLLPFGKTFSPLEFFLLLIHEVMISSIHLVLYIINLPNLK